MLSGAFGSCRHVQNNGLSFHLTVQRTLGHIESREEKFTVTNPAFSISCITNHTGDEVAN
jgi:hypothetical protein